MLKQLRTFYVLPIRDYLIDLIIVYLFLLSLFLNYTRRWNASEIFAFISRISIYDNAIVECHLDVLNNAIAQTLCDGIWHDTMN